MLKPPRAPRRAGLRGVSIVELMVGVTVGLIVVGASLQMFANNAAGSRRLVLDTRVQQDLRALADLLTRDLRRAGYWGNAIRGTLAVGSGAATTPNPYSAVSAASAGQITYAFTRDATENDALNDNEQFGFRLNSGVVEMQTASGTWQAVTNLDAVRMTTLAITPVETERALGHLCARTCAAGTPNCPLMKIRRYDVTLAGESARDATVRRELHTTVRVRADRLEGQCPP